MNKLFEKCLSDEVYCNILLETMVFVLVVLKDNFENIFLMSRTIKNRIYHDLNSSFKKYI